MQEKKKSIRDAYRKYMKAAASGGVTADDNTQLLKCLNDYLEGWRQERKPNEQQWRLNAQFYAGNHYVRDSGGGAGYRVRLRENHTNNALNRMLSIFIQNLPVTRVFPASISSDDLQNAENTEAFIRYFHRTKKMDLKWVKFIKYACIFGNGFMFRGFDPDAGGKILLDASETKSGDPEVREYRGDVKVEVDDPYRWNFRPGIDELDDHYDAIRSVPASREAIEAEHGEIDADSAKAFNAYSGTIRDDSDRVIVHHYYHKPTPWFEEGMYACWVGKRLLKVRAATESEKKLPAIHLPFDKPAMKLWGMSTIEQIMDLQEQINRASSMIVEARNLMHRPRVLASNEAKIPAQALSDKPGEIIRYALAGGPPQFVTPNFNFTELAGHKQDIKTAFNDVSGITSASRGEIPAAARTALALQLVLEQDRSQWAPFVKHYHQAILDTNQGVCEEAAEFFSPDDPRVIKIEGEQSSKLFHGGMVPTPLDAYLEDSNPIGWTASGRAEFIMELAKLGAIKDRTQLLEMLKLNSPDPAMKLININKQAASRENEDLKKGIPTQIGPEDDDAVHLDEHTGLMASYSFRSLPPAVQDAFRAHVEEHKARLSEGMQGAPAADPGMGGGKPADAMANQLSSPQPGAGMDQLLGGA
jgi:hypothetical protein